MSPTDASATQNGIKRPELNMSTIKESLNDPKADSHIKLSPTPRKSEREKKSISYEKLNKGVVERDEEEQAKDSDSNKVKKTEIKKGNIGEVQKKMSDLIELMKTHEAAAIFN